MATFYTFMTNCGILTIKNLHLQCDREPIARN